VHQEGVPASVQLGAPGYLRLTKHHGSGNDFLVLLGDAPGVGPEEVRALCDRHRGIGADGLIVGSPGDGGADLKMHLTNADGSPAEMSGNGIRCLVQAAVVAGMVSEGPVRVDTVAGQRLVDFTTSAGGLGFAEVDMGPALVGDDLALDEPPVSIAGVGVAARARMVNIGNPHLVLLAGDADGDLARSGPQIERAVDGGVNVELVRISDSAVVDVSAIALEVWERGVGITTSCGTGACASAAAANSWGLVSDVVDVHSPGGVLRVRISDAGVSLIGPVQLVAEIVMDSGVLRALVSEGRELVRSQ
jgi:diaminopimelate epimerase